jgi:hypothetical protein
VEQQVTNHYPVAVSAGTSHYPKSRLVIADGIARLFVDGRPPKLVAAGTVTAPLVRVGHTNVRTVEVDGDPWQVLRVSGCGCGSRLASMSTDDALAYPVPV